MAYSLDIVLGDCGNPYWQEQELWYRRLLPEFGMTGTIHYPNREGDPVSQTELVEKLLTRINIAGIVTEKINAMSVEELEKLVLTMMKKELNLIVSLGALIGFVLGLVNLLLG